MTPRTTLREIGLVQLERMRVAAVTPFKFGPGDGGCPSTLCLCRRARTLKHSVLSVTERGPSWEERNDSSSFLSERPGTGAPRAWQPVGDRTGRPRPSRPEESPPGRARHGPSPFVGPTRMASPVAPHSDVSVPSHSDFRGLCLGVQIVQALRCVCKLEGTTASSSPGFLCRYHDVAQAGRRDGPGCPCTSPSAACLTRRSPPSESPRVTRGPPSLPPLSRPGSRGSGAARCIRVRHLEPVEML